MFVKQKDMRSEPVRRVVALGESTTWGYLVSSDRVFEAIVRNCTFVARTMPLEMLITAFHARHGNGPDRSGGSDQAGEVR
jgi:hypothetical protein